jgi:hypothetical protein
VARYEDTLTLRQARERYFKDNGFGNGGYEDRWVKLQAGPIPIYMLNTAARVRSVKVHDLHHTATEYDTTWTGEAEIAAWEIASNCADHYAAWLLNLQAFAIGLAIAPAAVFRAFVRGRQTSNLYRTTFDDALLNETLASVRERLHLNRPVRPSSLADKFAFFGWAVLAGLTFAASALVPILVLVALVAALL